jgi:hypothetical protein
MIFLEVYVVDPPHLVSQSQVIRIEVLHLQCSCRQGFSYIMCGFFIS